MDSQILYFCQKCQMKHLTILVPDGHPNPITIISTFMAFVQAEKHQAMKKHKPVFEKIILAGISEKVSVFNGLFSMAPIADISDITKTDLVIIPAFLPQTNPEQNIEMNKRTMEWILFQYKNGAEVASLCTGAYVLAATGLVDDK